MDVDPKEGVMLHSSFHTAIQHRYIGLPLFPFFSLSPSHIHCCTTIDSIYGPHVLYDMDLALQYDLVVPLV